MTLAQVEDTHTWGMPPDLSSLPFVALPCRNVQQVGRHESHASCALQVLVKAEEHGTMKGSLHCSWHEPCKAHRIGVVAHCCGNLPHPKQVT